ncbi:MAG: biopolymer transporter ExbD [Nitrospirota bacterium]|nr:biopolymer transporter ExbD [Nitrospirota bacterium]
MPNRRRKGRRSIDATELNITPFMNLMVVLIPFLLSGVVFSRLAILEMKLPTSQTQAAASNSAKDPFRLVVTLRQNGVTVLGSDIKRAQFPKKESVYALEGLSDLLEQVKAKHPEESALILLSEPEIPYEALIAVMDACREKEGQALFPDISIGEVKVL